ncbi:MAG: SagB/ThcOx family dehydrogenase [Gallionella sp.]|nr:SagB/ThcOx family dehydrogenase [Gallionella sp.]
MKSPLDTVLDYHQRTKHHFQRYAAGPGGLDWKNQPDPFRTFTGCTQLELPLLGTGAQPLYAELYHPGVIAAQALTLPNIAALLELSFGLSAWKQYDNTRWALRCNPSSGNLHPTEAYLVVQGCSSIHDGVYHYVSRDHVLEQRCYIALTTHANARILPPDSFLIGLSSIHWREAWKYGERAFRYCQHDVGHAIAALRYAAAMLGWQVNFLDEWGDADIAAILGVNREMDFGAAEREHPDIMLHITTTRSGAGTAGFDASALVAATQDGHWQGRANVLSPHAPHPWPLIAEVAHACHKPPTRQTNCPTPNLPAPLSSACKLSAVEIIKQRRSAQEFDGSTSISAAAFYRMLDMTLPRAGVAPWDAIDWEPRIHLVLFVHRVDGLAPGIYIFMRNEHVETKLRTELSAKFEWLPVPDCPEHFSLFRLLSADAQNTARELSCHQDIAADGAFSLGMLAEYQNNLTASPWVYRQLFWEAGMLGQVLYLEAEAANVRGTGIGCYFDDEVHDLLGIKNLALQSMYHFTVGGAIADTRLQTLAAYEHLQRF